MNNRLHDDLELLASTLPDNPERVGGVMARVERRRRQRRAARAVAGSAFAVAALGGLVAVRGYGDHPSAAPFAAAPTAAPDDLPDCSTVDPNAPGASADPAAIAKGLPPIPADDLKTGTGFGTDATGPVTVAKGTATVVSVDETTVTVTFDGIPPDAAATVTAAFDATTQYHDRDTKLSGRPSLAPGDRVLIAVATTSSTTSVLELTVHAAIGEAPVAGKPANDPGPVKVEGGVIGVDGGRITVEVSDGAPAPGTVIVVDTDGATTWTIGSRECRGGAVITGSHVGLVVDGPDASGAYPVRSIYVASS